MPLLSRIACLLNHHDPDRSKVTWDGRNYVGHCRHCGAPIERRARRNWRKRKHAGEDSHGEDGHGEDRHSEEGHGEQATN